MRVVVIGYGTAGITAASYARLTNRKCEVEVFEKRPYAIYHPCSLPDVIAGLLKASDVVEEARSMPGIAVHTSTIVEDLDVDDKRIKARSLKTGNVFEVDYDVLVLATGSKPFVPRSIEIVDSDGVYTLKVVEDAEAIAGAAGKHSSAVVIGGSALGIETAYSLAKRGVRVTLVEYFPQLMPGKLDPDLAAEVKRFLESKGVEVIVGEGVAEISGEEGAKRVLTTTGRSVKAGFVVLATGVRPDTRIAEQAGIELGETGGVKVDEKMQTSVDDVYAAGDVAEVKNLLTGKPTLSPFASTALLMGRVAGINAAGGNAALRGVLQNWIVNLEGFKFGAVGLTVEAARKAGFNAVSTSVTAYDKPSFYPDAETVTIKLTVDNEGRLLGAQVMGGGDVLGKLNVLSVAISLGASLNQLPYMELAYTPSLNELINPLYVAADALLRRLRRRS